MTLSTGKIAKLADGAVVAEVSWLRLIILIIMHIVRAYYFTQIVERVELCGNITECNGHAVVTF